MQQLRSQKPRLQCWTERESFDNRQCSIYPSLMFNARALLFAVLAVFPYTVSANISIFTNSAAWQSVSTNLTAIDFAPYDTYPYLYSSGLTIGDVTFTGSPVNGQGYLYVEPGYDELGRYLLNPNILLGPPAGAFYFGQNLFPNLPGSGIEVNLPADATTVSFSFGNHYRGGDFGPVYKIGLEVDFADGTIYSDPSYIEGLGIGFIGFTSTSPINSFEILGGGFPVVANFEYGQTTTAATPEPSYLVVMVVLLTAVFVKRK